MTKLGIFRTLSLRMLRGPKYEYLPHMTVHLFILSLNFPEHLNVTTVLGLSIKSPPFAGFLPLRSCFFLTQNLPNPETKTSSPDARVPLIISIRLSTVPTALFFGYPVLSKIEFTMSALVRVIWGSSFIVVDRMTSYVIYVANNVKKI